MAKKSNRHKTSSARPAPREAHRATGAAGVRIDASLIRVAVVFVVLYAALMTLLWLGGLADVFEPLMRAIAGVTGFLLRVVGIDAVVDGRDVVLASRVLRIDLDCTALPIVLIFVSLVAAYPVRIKERLFALATGVPVIFVANFARLTGVGIFSEILGDEAFSFVHDYLFKVFMMAVVIVLWGVFLVRARRHARA